MTIACILEPEPSTGMKAKRTLDPESSTMADRQTLNSNLKASTVTESPTLDPESSTVTDNRTLDPESSNVMDKRTLDPESSASRSEPLHQTSYRTQADALFRKNLTYQVPYTQPDIWYL